MSGNSSATARPNVRPRRWIIIGVCGAMIVVVACFLAVRVGILAPLIDVPTIPDSAPLPAEPSTESESRTEVRLTDEKLVSAGIQETSVASRGLREMRTTPGVLTYDATHHLELTIPVEAMVVKVFVEPGQKIKKGEQLAILSSAEIGLARDEVSKREADLAIVQKEFAWVEEIGTNVEYLLELFEKRPAIADLEKGLGKRPLGDYREKLFSSYSRLLFAESVLVNSDNLETRGALSQRMIEERRSTREIARATFQSACETASFDAARQRDQTRASAEHSERLLRVSKDRLSSLLGPQGSTYADANGTLSEFVITAPMDGWIQERLVTASARVPAGKALFTLADTTSLWISAEIHERDWRALSVSPDDEIKVRVPALNNQEFTAKLRFFGSQVAADTRSVPLVANLDNQDGKFRPGMFVWVDVPLEKERKALTVPPAAVMRHENQAFVFVPTEDRTFRRQDVKTGLETSDAVEVVSGLTNGERVVSQGSFFLKSELLLERSVD